MKHYARRNGRQDSFAGEVSQVVYSSAVLSPRASQEPSSLTKSPNSSFILVCGNPDHTVGTKKALRVIVWVNFSHSRSSPLWQRGLGGFSKVEGQNDTISPTHFLKQM